MTTMNRPRYEVVDLDRELAPLVAAPPRVRISLKRLASGEWQPDFSVESFDADPATDTGYSLIARRLEDVDSLVRQRIKQFTDRDAGVIE